MFVAVNTLLKYGADTNARNNNQMSPLHTSVKFDYYCKEIVLALLNKGADLNLLDFRPWSPIFYSVCTNKVDVTALFLERGAQIDHIDHNKNTILHIASESPGTASFLLEGKFYNVSSLIERRNSCGETCLLAALRYVNRPLALSLIQRGADIQVRNKNNFTAFMVACANAPVKTDSKGNCVNCSIIRIVEAAGGHLDGHDPALTDFMKQILVSKHVCGLEYLLKKKLIKPYIRENFSPLHFAVKNKSIRAIEALLKYGADVDEMHLSKTPLEIALHELRYDEALFEIVTALLKKNPDLDGILFGHTTILNKILTDYNSSIKSNIIFLILDYGANVFSFAREIRQTLFSTYGVKDLEWKLCLNRNNTVNELWRHFIKLSILQGAVVDTFENFEPFVDECKQEVKSLKKHSIKMNADDENLFVRSCYTLLTMSLHNMSCGIFKIQGMCDKFKNVDFTSKFPVYGSMIAAKVSRASLRASYLGNSYHFFEYIFKNCGYTRLPNLCVNLILSYLKCSSLKNLGLVLHHETVES